MIGKRRARWYKILNYNGRSEKEKHTKAEVEKILRKTAA